jgi:hypothetical protein
MKRQVLEVTTAISLSLLFSAPSVAQRGAPGRTRNESAAEARRGTQRLATEKADQAQRAARTDANDADFQKFFEYVPRDEWPAALSESSYIERRGPQQEFQYQELNYPKGDRNTTSYRFDMGPDDALVESGYIKIAKDDLFTWEKGYGWSIDTPDNDFAYTGYDEALQEKLYRYGIIQNQGLRRVFEKRNRAMDFPPIRNMWGDPDFYDDWLDDVSRDAVLDPHELAFKVALPNGRYLVSLIIGDMQIPRFGIDVYANGYLAASNTFTGKILFRGFTEPASPWPSRVSFPVDVVRNNLRIALRPNGNMYKERVEVMAETPDYNFSQMPFCYGRLSKFFGKRMSTHGPPTQMALAGVTITPYVNTPLSLHRQQLVVEKTATDSHARQGVEQYNADDLEGAEASFDEIPDSEYRLKALAYLAVAGHFEARPEVEQRTIGKAIAVLKKACVADPDDVWAADQLTIAKMFQRATYLVLHASEESAKTNLSEVKAQVGALLNWIGPEDILYSKALMHTGRAYASIDPHRWTPSWHLAEEAFLKLEDTDPGNRFSGYYLYNKMEGWALRDYQSDVGDAPPWAVLMREGYNRLLDQIEWWGKHRQRDDGGLGGGWGDDVEIGMVWEWITLVNPDASPAATEVVRGIAEGVWWGGEIDRDAGYFDGMADVEHTGEWTGDSQAVMMGIEYGNPIYYERNLKTAKLMRDLWMGYSERGHLHFKSMVLGNKRIGDSYGGVHDACIDHPLQGRAASPAFWAWWYSPTDELERIFSEWATAWLEDSEREENGKPAGVIPGPIGFPSDNLGGAGYDTWCRGVGCYQNPWYSHYVVNLFGEMYRKTGDQRWLQPRAALVDSKTKEVNPRRGKSVASALADRKIEDRGKFIEELGLASAIQRFRDSWPSVTSEVAATDRIAPPGLHEMYRMLLGDHFEGGMNSIPFTLEQTSRNIAFLNLWSAEQGAKTIFYNFSDVEEHVNMRLWKIQVGGEFEVTLGIDSNDDDHIDEVLGEFRYTHVHRGDSIQFAIPARKSTVVEVRQTKPGKGIPDRVVDLAMAPQDIQYADGKLRVTVHNIGNQHCGPFKVEVITAPDVEASRGDSAGQILDVPGLEAPNDLEPRTVTLEVEWALPADATLENPARVTVRLDPADEYYEITETNNQISRSFPYEDKPYMTPRVWPSLVRENRELEKYQPFPADYPKNQIR